MAELRPKRFRRPVITALTAFSMATIQLTPKVVYADTNGKPPEVQQPDGTVIVEVSTPTELQYIDMHQSDYQNSTIELMNSLDMSGVILWSPFVDFGGTFNGNNHSISHLAFPSIATIPVPDPDSKSSLHLSGIFANTLKSATIENLILNDINIVNTNGNPSDYLGSLVGANAGGIIQNVGVLSGVVSDANAQAAIGGLIGFNDYGSVINCYANIRVENTAVSPNDTLIGTMIGNDTGGAIASYSTGTVAFPWSTKKPEVRPEGYSPRDTVLWDSDFNPNPSVANGFNTHDLEKLSTFTSNLLLFFDMTNTWSIVDGVTFPFLKGTLPITVDNTRPTQYQSFTTQLNTELTPPNGQSLTWHPVSLPQGFSLSSNGVLTGTPTTSGPLSVTAVAYLSPSNPVVYGYGTITLDVQPGQSASISLNPTLPQGTVRSSYHAIVTASGGTSPYTYSVTTGTLPSGLTLSSDGTLSGTPSAAGSYTFTVQAQDVHSKTGTQQYTIDISPPPPLSSNADLSRLTLSAGTLSPVFDPKTTDYTTTVSTSVTHVDVTPTVEDSAASMNVNGNTATSGTPTDVLLNVGANPVTVTVTAADGSTKTYTITIIRQAATPGPVLPPPLQPLSITTPTLGLPGRPNQPFMQMLTTTGGTGSYTWAILDGRLPQGLTLNPTTGVISGSTGYTQPVILTVQVTDSAGRVQQKRIVVDVLSQNDREMIWQTTDLHAENVPALVGMDAGTPTTYMPIWYVMQMLKSYGVTSTWDGSHWYVTAPADVALHPISRTGTMSIYVNGHLVQEANGTYAIDPNSKHMTTFMPIWYVQQLMKALNIANTWDGTTWTVTLPDSTSKSTQ